MSALKNALLLSHEYIKKVLKEGNTAVDATCGNGHDTLFLSEIVGKSGRVFAFDIQEKAIESTRARLFEYNAPDNTTLILDGHEHMNQHITGMVRAVMFNFGYLPGGDHQKATQTETSIAAVRSAMHLLSSGGIITLCIYSGGDTGFSERDGLLAFCKTIDPNEFFVLSHEFINQENNPPILVCIEKK